MSLLTPDSGLLFWMVIVFGIVFVILAKYGFPVITRMVDERKQYIDKSLLAAREANEQLANIKADSEMILAKESSAQMQSLPSGAGRPYPPSKCKAPPLTGVSGRRGRCFL